MLALPLGYSRQHMPLTNSELERCAYNRNSRGTATASDGTRCAVQHTLSAMRKLEVVHVDAVQERARQRRLGHAALCFAVAGKIPDRRIKLGNRFGSGVYL